MGSEGSMLYVGIDPGVTTGFVILEGCDRVAPPLMARFSQEIPSRSAYKEMAWLLRLLRDTKEMDKHTIDIEVESFIGGGRRTSDAATTLEIIGFTVGYAKELGLPVEKKAPQTRKPFIPQAKTLWVGNPSDHIIDATAHALHCAYRNGVDCAPR